MPSADRSATPDPVPPSDPLPTLRSLVSADSADTFPPEVDDVLGEFGLGVVTRLSPEAGDAGPPPRVDPFLNGYELIEELGRGGMGVVYLARDTNLRRLVAVKMIRPGGQPTAAELVRFQGEAEAVAAVIHPNVVKVHASGWHAGRPYYVMEYAAGGSLARRLKEAGPLPPSEAAALVAAVARGVQAAHAAGIVHRDLKASNVLLGVGSEQRTADEKGHVPQDWLSTAHAPLSTLTPKVSDFGLARRLGTPDGMTATGAMVGTPAYMAPEQARGRGKFVGPEADVYALGGILYECLTGAVPFADDDPVAFLRKVAEDAPVPPRRRAAGVPRDLDLICLKCLAKQPRDRYATAGELAEDLDRFLAGRPVVARPIPAAVRVARWARHNPLAAMQATLLLLVLVGGPAAVVWYQWKLDESATKTASAIETGEREAAARREAEKLAAARELIAVQGDIRRREADRPPGWTWDNRADLARAAALAADSDHDMTALRAEATTALLTPDLRPARSVAPGYTAAVAATSPDGAVVALGEFKAWGALGLAPPHIRLIDPASGKTTRTLAFTAGRVAGPNGGWVQDGVRSVAFAPDGRRLFATTRDGRVLRFDLDAAGNAPARTWTAPAMARSLAVSADGRALYAVCGSKLFVGWDAETGAETGRRAAEASAGGIAVDTSTGALVGADGPALFRADPESLAATDSVVLPGRDQYIRALAFLPGGRALVVARAGQVELCDAATLRPTARLTDPDLLNRAAHAETVTALAAHPSGAYLATGTDSDRFVKVWEVASGRVAGTVRLPGAGPVGLAWSGDGRHLLATATGHTARFEFAVPAAVRFAGVQPYPLEAAALAAGGRVVALGESPLASPNASRLLFRTGPAGRVEASVAVPVRPPGSRAGLALHPRTDAVLFTRADGGIGRWHPGGPPGESRFTPQATRLLRYSPDGSAVWAVVDSSRVQAWDADTGAPRGERWENVAGTILSGLPGVDALAVGRTRSVAAGADGTVHLFDDRVKHLTEFLGRGDPVLAVALTPGEEWVAAGTQGGRLRLVRLADRTELPAAAAHPGGLHAVGFSRDGSLLATGGRDRTVRLWRRTATGYAVLTAASGLPAPVRTVEFAPDGDRLLVLLAGERAARVWDVTTLNEQLGEMKLGW